MELEEGTKVKVYLKDQMVVEGFVHSWSNIECSIGNGRGDLLVINNPKENIIMVHIYYGGPKTDPAQNKTPRKPPYIAKVDSYAQPDITKHDPFRRTASKTR